MAAPLVFIVDDDATARRLLEHAIGSVWGWRTAVFQSGEECLLHLDEGPDLIVLDILMGGISGVETLARVRERFPELPVIILSSQNRIEVAIETMKLGAHDYFTKPVDLKRLEFSVRNALELSGLRHQVRALRESLDETTHFANILSHSGVMKDVLRLVDKARMSDITVLIEGESGTGKEMIARAMHFHGRRKDGPFVVVNCAAIPKDLLESELFGHEKGSFTGAVALKPGKFEQAHGGTLFLDEIGELELPLQAKMLRAIQQRQFERIGGTETITVDVRIVSATNRSLLAMAQRGEFREDLYYRLATFPVKLPPLRERRGDIALLADHFLREAERKEGKEGMVFSPTTFQRILSYAWPGNVRELQSAVERAVLLADGNTVHERDLPAAIHATPLSPFDPGIASDLRNPAVPQHTADTIVPMEVVKEQAIRAALHVTGGALAEAARRLGIGRTTLYELTRKYRIDTRDYTRE